MIADLRIFWVSGELSNSKGAWLHNDNNKVVSSTTNKQQHFYKEVTHDYKIHNKAETDFF